MKQNKHIQLPPKKAEFGFSRKGPFKGLRVEWQPKQNQFIASMRQTFNTECVKMEKEKKTLSFLRIHLYRRLRLENFTLV